MRTPAVPLALLAAGVLAGATSAPAQLVRATPRQAPAGWIGVSYTLVPAGGPAGRDARALVTAVGEDSPAAAAGVSVGDVLVSINGRSAAGAAGRLWLRQGDEVELVVLREGRPRTLTVRAVARPALAPPPPGAGFARTDSMVDALFRAMDSLRMRIVRRSNGQVSVEAFVRPRPLGDDPAPEVRVPFEFFVFGGDAQDSLRRAMGELNRAMREAHTRHRRLDQQARSAAAGERLREDLAQVRALMDEQSREAADLKRAMAEAARSELVERGWATQAAPDLAPGAEVSRAEPTVVFRPLTPYLLGRNRAAGAEVVELNPALADYFGVGSGVLVVDVPEGTPADAAGLQPGDVITRVNGREVRVVDDLRAGLAVVGGPVALTVVRRGRRLEVALGR